MATTVNPTIFVRKTFSPKQLLSRQKVSISMVPKEFTFIDTLNNIR